MSRANHMTVIPFGGLGNRLRVLNSAFFLSRDIGADVELVWFVKPELNSELGDMFAATGFEYFPMSRWKRALLKPFLKHIYIQKYESTYRRFLRLFYDQVYFDNDLTVRSPSQLRAEIAQHGRVLIATCYQFYDFENFDNLVVQPQLRQRIDALTARFDRNTVGVHIRRTDHTALIKASPVELFTDRMKQLEGEDPDVKFFLATDDASLKTALREQFGQRLITQDIPLSRATAEGMQGAVVDIYALSQTKKIICTTRSSFAQMAALIGAEKEIIEVC
ncbi:hypothetical protein [Persicitalea jodogahamensis]|uniref:Alpha-(1,6)-fucosyltransferase N- and catalytic domain-containing protein n=1 Tax=Persicitalea jodogahamensis TaxID=402147 RepID=A0A8J3D7J3_9BACT|nr:hypothetical protein [Persicitalea jodogahamensis]GHB56836.1 hypothetical protein GCM10007390_07790 [Persicitalea jodogahamensis]